MSYTIASILPRAAAQLNDVAQQIFTNAAMLPYAQDAGDILQLELELNGILVLEKVSAVIVVPATTTKLSTPAGGGPTLIPTDMLEPQRMDERLNGSSDLFVEMTARQWAPEIYPTDSLRYWVYREEDIFFVGATSNRDVKIYYLKRLLNIIDATSVVAVNNSQQFMIKKIAALSARFIGENPTRAEELDNEAAAALKQVIRIGTKNKQRARTRRRPFVLVGRRRWA